MHFSAGLFAGICAGGDVDQRYKKCKTNTVHQTHEEIEEDIRVKFPRGEFVKVKKISLLIFLHQLCVLILFYKLLQILAVSALAIFAGCFQQFFFRNKPVSECDFLDTSYFETLSFFDYTYKF